ncbi:glycoside hydrolase family 44 protein [Kiritimatiella glycovorans]|uniref:Beta-mannanase/endoglucanase A n=1 Tax=Kiritimatiella glycovorans TaxID=1307763 RepID=A0A0G3EID2_9BACT|nr:glycoside hydrolase family 44 protein [Kiritimatiella glycovorans]AKJ63894.1 Beta-mannanase/endoglucanase A precursor [Kiritimatiella glycovorans]
MRFSPRRRWIAALGMLAGFSAACGDPDAVAGWHAVIRPNEDARPISERIYGVAAADEDDIEQLAIPFVRWGGNTASRYNWELGNAWNTGADWYFENVAVESNAWRRFLRRCRDHGAAAIVTVPLVGWVAKDTSSYSFPVERYGPQRKTDPHRPDAGDGVRPDGSPVPPGDPSLTSRPMTPDFAAQWVRAMRREFPEMFAQRRIVLALGNEPMLWDKTHRDVHPEPVSYREYLRRFTDMAVRLKDEAPDTPIAGPELWGWPAWFESARDRESAGAPDRRAHGSDFVPWFLERMREYERRHGTRLLDILTLHYYPQAEGVFSKRNDPATSARRLEAPRSLWDPEYRDPSWIGRRVRMIPRMRAWVRDHYPGTRIGVTEYNWGGEQAFSGAAALADALGIFGREGLDAACYWTVPPADSAARRAFSLYRNADGKGAKFGDTSLRVEWRGAGPEYDELTLYAAASGSPGAFTAVVVGKSPHPAPLRLSMPEIDIVSMRGYVFGETRPEILPLGEERIEVVDGSARLWLPGMSIIHLRWAAQ